MCVRYRLVLRSADGHEFPFDNFPVVIGRWAGCDLVLPFGPRRLARIFLDGYLYIADLQGVIGVFADSSRISEPVRLKTGMELGFGDEATFQVEVFVDPDKSPATQVERRVRSTVLHDYLIGATSATFLAKELSAAASEHQEVNILDWAVDDMTDELEVNEDHLVKLCDAALLKHIPLEQLEAIGLLLIAGDHFSWDNETASGQHVAQVVHEWAAPEIHYPLNFDTVMKCRGRLAQ